MRICLHQPIAALHSVLGGLRRLVGWISEVRCGWGRERGGLRDTRLLVALSRFVGVADCCFGEPAHGRP